MDGPDGLNGYWHDLRKEERFFSRRNFGGGSLMVWGAFSSVGQLEIQFASTRMNSTDYTNVLRSSLLPYLRDNADRKWIFQQDNAPIHKSNFTKNWLSQKGIEALTWPACSPDLNPMENIWGILVRRIYANQRQFDTIEALKREIIVQWDNLDLNLLNKLALSMNKRTFELIKANGNQINY